VIVLAREDDVHLYALQIMSELFQLCEWEIVFLENCIAVQK
jgi:hypothetical protein